MTKKNTTVLLKNINNIALETENGLYIKHKYNIPNYQRGYRWERAEVLALLNDIWEFLNSYNDLDEKYCLQPIVLKLKDESFKTGFIQGQEAQQYTLYTWDVIDGQQRLTTLYLIMQYLSPFSGGEIYELSYSSRGTEEKLTNWQNELIDYNPRKQVPQPLLEYCAGDDLDIYFMANAVKTINEWFCGKMKENTDQSVKQKFSTFREHVYVIWYEIASTGDEIEAIDLFTRLNIGKIPLTNAELIKAVLLKQSSTQDERLQQQKALEWDQIEISLSNDEFFYFLCSTADVYETRIDYLFLLNYLNNCIKNQQSEQIPDGYGLFSFYVGYVGTSDIWGEIKSLHQLLCQWYKDHRIYHKIGFLVACCRYQKKKSAQNDSLHLLANLIAKYHKEKSKKAFMDELNDNIRETVKSFYPKADHQKGYLPLNELTYLDHHDAIEQLLLLFNVLSMEQSSCEVMRFSFDRFLPKKKGDEWSLEHICPQNLEDCDSTEKQQKWLDFCLNELHGLKEKNIATKDMMKKCDTALAELQNAKAILTNKGASPLADDEFNRLAVLYQSVGSELVDDQDIHTISNLALLPRDINSAFSNKLFFQKRLMMMEYDKGGNFIPLCTHNVFLKYYSQKDTQLYFWTESDRDAYFKSIKNSLCTYLQEGAVKDE
jgi:hypothetical protein